MASALTICEARVVELERLLSNALQRERRKERTAEKRKRTPRRIKLKKTFWTVLTIAAVLTAMGILAVKAALFLAGFLPDILREPLEKLLDEFRARVLLAQIELDILRGLAGEIQSTAESLIFNVGLLFGIVGLAPREDAGIAFPNDPNAQAVLDQTHRELKLLDEQVRRLPAEGERMKETLLALVVWPDDLVDEFMAIPDVEAIQEQERDRQKQAREAQNGLPREFFGLPLS